MEAYFTKLGKTGWKHSFIRWKSHIVMSWGSVVKLRLILEVDVVSVTTETETMFSVTDDAMKSKAEKTGIISVMKPTEVTTNFSDFISELNHSNIYVHRVNTVFLLYCFPLKIKVRKQPVYDSVIFILLFITHDWCLNKNKTKKNLGSVSNLTSGNSQVNICQVDMVLYLFFSDFLLYVVFIPVWCWRIVGSQLFFKCCSFSVIPGEWWAPRD